MKLLQQKVSEIINKLAGARNALALEGKPFTISDAWNLFQTALAEIVKIIEAVLTDVSGAEKKAIALQYLDKFYDDVIVKLDIPYVPSALEPVVKKVFKKLFMYLANGAIDATVNIFKKLGVFTKE